MHVTDLVNRKPVFKKCRDKQRWKRTLFSRILEPKPLQEEAFQQDEEAYDIIKS